MRLTSLTRHTHSPNHARSYPDYRLKAVDVRDVAKAHVLALVNPGANGR